MTRNVDALSAWISCFFLCILSVWLRSPAVAQTAPQAWINPAQTYYKIPSVKRALVRLTRADLAQAGVPARVNPQAFQLFHRGTELAVFVAGEADGTFDDPDYLEFLSRGADGTGDSTLYLPRAAQPHAYYNLYTDTTAYFLTWRLDGGRGKRMATVPALNPGTLTPEAYHLAERLELRTGDYAAGTFYPLGSTSWSSIFYTTYDWGEGYTGGTLKKNNPGQVNFNLEGYVRTGPKPQLEFQVMGRDPSAHVIDVKAGTSAASQRLLGTVQPPNYRHVTFRQTLEPTDVSPGNELWVSTTSRGSGTDDAYCHTYARLTFPQRFLPGELRPYHLRPNPAGTSLIEIPDAAAGAVLLDITDETAPRRLGTERAGTTLRAVVPGTSAARTLLLVAASTPPVAIRAVRFRNYDLAKTNFAVVSHPKLMRPAGGYPDAVRAYAAYRASAAGGRHDTLVVTMQELVDEFNYGEWSPLAIRHFAEQLHRQGKQKMLFLIGQGRWPHHVRTAANRYDLDPIPNAGWPSADPPLVMGLNGEPPFQLSLPLGRLNAADPQTVIDYLEKVREHEALGQSQLWQKNVLHLSGGKSASELSLFKSYIDDFKRRAERGQIGPRIHSISKKTDEPVEFIDVTDRVNQGVGMITFFGHSSGESADIDIGFASNPLLGHQNRGRYPFVFVNGCDAGNVFYDGGLKTFGTDWINTPRRGGILFLATTYAGYPFALKSYSDRLYEALFVDSTGAGKPFGYVMREAVRRYDAGRLSYFEQAHAQQFTLQGDPAVVLFPATRPDYAIDEAGLSVQPFGANAAAVPDSFRLAMIVSNLGRLGTGPLNISVKRTLGNGTVRDLGSRDFPAVRYQDTLFVTVRNDPGTDGGPNRFEVTLDPLNRLAETTKTNNRATLHYLLPGTAATPLLPQDFAVLNTLESGTPTVTLTAETTQVRVRNGAAVPQNVRFELDTSATFSSPFKKVQTVPAAHLPGWKVGLLPADSVVYFWRVIDADQPIGPANQWSERSFTFVRTIPEGWSQRAGAQLAKSARGPGTLTSPLIGPASSWGTFRLDVRGVGTQLEVFGVDGQETEVLLRTGPASRLTDLSAIDPKRYPYLRLRLRRTDGTAPRPDRWLVTFAGVPEVVVDPVQQPFNAVDEKQEGEPFSPRIAFRNVSGRAFADSVTIRQVLTNRATGQQRVRTAKVAPLGAGQSVVWNTDFATLGNAGENHLRVTFNPTFLPEQTYANNSAELTIDVQADRKAPVLGVTIDGWQLRDGDVVSASPVIGLRLRDENPFLIRSDTTGVDVLLGDDSLNAPLRRLSFRENYWTLHPPNEFRAELRPGPLPAGTYQLRVQGRDRSGNLAGGLPYFVRFRVVTEPGLQPLVVYPNPTRAFTRFSFQTTGAQVEGRFRLRVFTLAGQLVGEYFSRVQTGTNAYRWDGTDASGQPLPAGTYLYEALIRTNQNGPEIPPWRGRVVILR